MGLWGVEKGKAKVSEIRTSDEGRTSEIAALRAGGQERVLAGESMVRRLYMIVLDVILFHASGRFCL